MAFFIVAAPDYVQRNHNVRPGICPSTGLVARHRRRRVKGDHDRGGASGGRSRWYVRRWPVRRVPAHRRPAVLTRAISVFRRGGGRRRGRRAGVAVYHNNLGYALHELATATGDAAARRGGRCTAPPWPHRPRY